MRFMMLVIPKGYEKAKPDTVPDPKAQRQRIVLPGEVPSPAYPPPGCPFHPRCPHPKKNERCRTEPPALREVAPEHHAACHFAEEPL